MNRVELSAEGGYLLIHGGGSHTYTRFFRYFWREAIMATVKAELPDTQVDIHRVDLVEA